MMSGSSLSRTVTLLVLTGLLTPGTAAHAQARWTVDPKLSLAWWQVTPHLGHLWATTCPQEPSWRPGDGRSGGWMRSAPLTRTGTEIDTIRMPRYPRYEALPICTEAVDGEIVVGDAVSWRGVRGLLKVQASALVTGSEDRDAYARETILQVARFPDMRFAIDSVLLTGTKADTQSGTALGVFTLRGKSQPMAAALRAWPEAGGLRVTAKFRINAGDLVPVWGFSHMALGLGVGTKIWQYVYGGVDVVLRRNGTGGTD